MNEPSVLLVDGEASGREALGRLLRHESFAAFVAGDAEEALELLRRHPRIGAVVSNLRVPESDGIELLSRARELRPLSVGVLVREGETSAAVHQAAAQAGVFRHVCKPWEPRELLTAVDDALGQHRMLYEHRRLRVLGQRRNRQLRRLRLQYEEDLAASTRSLEADNARLHRSLLGLARLVALAVEPGGDAGRAAETARNAVAIGRRLGLPARELEDLRLAALLLQVGRLGLPPAALAAKGPNGQRLRQDLARRGATLVQPASLPDGVVEAIRHRHERWDGRGVPDGLSGQSIPRLARVLAVAADHVDAVRGEDAREVVSSDEAQAALVRGAGRCHDPEVVAALVDVLAGTAPATSSEPELAATRN